MDRSRTATRVRRHLLLGFGSAALAAATWALTNGEPQVRWSLAAAYPSLLLAAGTLVIGPLNVLRGRASPVPVSTDLRRDLGIWCAVLGLAHVVLGLQVHMGSPWLYFFRGEASNVELVPRTDLFGVANHVGLVATLLLTFLLSLSNDLSLRRLGGPRWKALQRWNYAFMVATVVHAVGYQVLERRSASWVVLLTALSFVVLGAQLVARARVIAGGGRSRQGRDADRSRSV